ncbi:hypothetical protein Zmor_015703 [Zophobas morio]|uniref:Uncharacterized protein n=1 Tax=Zophobas morio TaxID=2755281 RepID=A0AA38MHE1_9CUCU|nr:hypothetical protein Zmor_015703 [Zophobas morio]
MCVIGVQAFLRRLTAECWYAISCSPAFGLFAPNNSMGLSICMSEPLLKKNEFLGAQGRTTSTLWNFAIRRDRASLSHCLLVPPFRAWEKPFPPRVPAHYHIWLYVRRPSILFMVLGITQHFVAPPMTSNVLLVCLVAYATATMITVADMYLINALY